MTTVLPPLRIATRVVRRPMLSPASFHSNTRGWNTTTVQLKTMGILLGVPLQSLVMGITLPGEIVILQNAVVRRPMLSPASFHSNTRGLNTTTVQLKTMGILLGVPLQLLVMGITLPGEIVMLQNAVVRRPMLSPA